MAIPVSSPANPLPAATAATTDGYNIGNTQAFTQVTGDVATGRSFKLGERLDQMVEGKGIMLNRAMYTTNPAISYLMWDYNNTGKSLKNKFIPVDVAITADGQSLTWFDVDSRVKGLNVTADAANVTTFTNSTTRGFQVGDTVIVTRKKGSSLAREKRVLTAVIADTSITFDAPVDLEAGDVVNGLYHVEEKYKKIERKAEGYGQDEFRSFFQRFGTQFVFTSDELNRSYFDYKDSAEYIKDMLMTNIQNMMITIERAMFEGSNAGWVKPEMLGISTALKEVLGNYPSMSVDASTATDTQKLKLLRDVTKNYRKSGIAGTNKKITVLANEEMINNITDLYIDKIIYNDVFKGMDFSIPTIRTPYGEFEFLGFNYLDLFQDSYGIVVPRHLMAGKIKKIKGLNTLDTQSMELNKVDIRFEKLIEYANIPDADGFQMYMDLGQVLGWLSFEWAYQELKNF